VCLLAVQSTKHPNPLANTTGRWKRARADIRLKKRSFICQSTKRVCDTAEKSRIEEVFSPSSCYDTHGYYSVAYKNSGNIPGSTASAGEPTYMVGKNKDHCPLVNTR
jgi:hypothetical protein